tara:strand:- start:2255 stop:2908 length:654 start_codon:yes stop_codon:yes gene_type:complete
MVPSREVQSVESVYEFFTKQRPLAWSYYYRSRALEAQQGATLFFTDGQRVRLEIDTIDEGYALVVNSLTVTFTYNVNPSTSDRPNVKGTLNDYDLVGADFYYNISSDESSLADVNKVFANNQIGGLSEVSPDAGFNVLNQDVLSNNDSGTALYLFEPGKLYVDFFCGLNGPGFYGYCDTTIPLSDLKSLKPIFHIEIKGHLLNKGDALLLKSLIQNN